MYLGQFRLQRPPFEETTNLAFFYDAPSRRAVLCEALEHLHRKADMILISGEEGSGKTMLGRVLMQRLKESTRILSLSLPPSGVNSVLKQICVGFRLDRPTCAHREKCIAGIVRSLSTRSRTRCVVFIDRAEHLFADNFLELGRLVGATADAGLGLTLVLIAGEQIEASLRLPEMKLLSGAIIRTKPLPRLSVEETVAYVAARLHAAGSDGGKPFTPGALRRLASHAGGRPRRINEFAKRALVRAARRKVSRIDEEFVVACSKEIGDMATTPMPESAGQGPSEADQQAARRPRKTVGSVGDAIEPQSLVESLEDFSATAPERTANGEEDTTRQENKTRETVAQAVGRAHPLASDPQPADERSTDIETRFSRLEQALSRAEEVIQQADEEAHAVGAAGGAPPEAESNLPAFVQKLANIAGTAEERVSLLLTSLDAAQGIHEKLERMGEQISALVDESHRVAVEEHDRLHASFEELRTRREAFGREIDEIRREGQSVLAQSKQTCDEARRLEGEARRALEIVTEQFRSCGDRLTAMSDSQERSKRLTEEAREATQNLRSGIEKALSTVQELISQGKQTSQLKNEFASALEGLKDRGLASIKRALAEADSQFARNVAQLEGIVAAEKDARCDALETVRGAKSALAKVRESERTLAEAQGAAINIEATASAALASLQQEVKRGEDSVGVVVDRGVRKAESAIASAVELGTKLAQKTAQSVKNEATCLIKDLEQAVRSATTAAGDQKAAMHKAIEEAARSADTIAREQIEKTQKAAQRASTEAGKLIDAAIHQFEKQNESTQLTCAEAVKRVSEAVSAREADLDRRLEEAGRRLESMVAEALGQINAEVRKHTAAAAESIASVGRNEAQRVEQTARRAIASAEDHVRDLASSAAGAIREHLEAAAETKKELGGAVAVGRQTVAEAGACREQIDHLTRDVWALTSTTDQRAKALAALAETAQTTEAGLETLVEKAEAQGADLATQSAAAQKAGETLAARQAQTEHLCVEFTDKIAVAQNTNAELARSNETGKTLEGVLTSRAAQLNDLLGQAAAIVETIHSEEDKARETSRVVQQLTEATDGLEQRLVELQEALANPMAVIQDAGAQAEELNDICLAVKRVFRSVSKASLEANERIKMLGKLLVATERSGQTLKQWTERSGQSMKQWVDEAARAQERLASTLEQVPSVSETHPLVATPDLGKGAVPSELGGKRTDAVGEAAPPRSARGVGQSAGHRSPGTLTRSAAVASAAPGPPRVVKKVEPLVDVLRARQEAKAQGMATAAHDLPTSVARSDSGTPMPATCAAPGNHLRPEDVQAMIDEAKKKAART